MPDRFYREKLTPMQQAMDDVSRLHMNLSHNKKVLLSDPFLSDEDGEKFDRLLGDLVWLSALLQSQAHKEGE